MDNLIAVGGMIAVLIAAFVLSLRAERPQEPLLHELARRIKQIH